MPQRLSDSELEAIKSWDGQLFHDRVLRHIGDAGLDRIVSSAMRKLGSSKFALRFKSSTDKDFKSFSTLDFHWIAKLCLLLQKYKSPLRLDDLLSLAPAPQLEDQIFRIDMQLKRVNSLQNVIGRTLRDFADDAVHKLRETLEREAGAIAEGVTSQTGYGHVTASEVRAIGECSTHIRVITTRLDFGVEWENEKTGKPEKRRDFERIADVLSKVRHTFIVPKTLENDYWALPPSPLSGGTSPTWEERVEMFSNLYKSAARIDQEYWSKNILFRHTTLPIPAGTVLFGLSPTGFARLADTRPSLLEDLSAENNHFILPTPDRGAFVGIVIPGSRIPKLSALMNQRAILFAANAFLRYWDHLEPDEKNVDPDPRLGLPTGPTSEFREPRQLAGDA